jgi:lycopene cyclase domain-containing protein
MTYLQFHLIFNLPALLLLLWLTRQRLRPVHLQWIVGLCGIVLLTTTPWDNWAVHRGIWDFDARRVTELSATLGGVKWHLPAEEYAFFLVETVLVSLLTLLFLPDGNAEGEAPPPSPE